MPGSIVGRRDRELAAIRLDLALIAVDVESIRIARRLARKYRTEQPRLPADRPDGGRWVSEGSGDPGTTGSIGQGNRSVSRTEETVTEDGSRVLSIRIRADPRADWDEQHTVTAPDGTRTVFETSGLTQTVRDGETGDVLGKSTLTADGAEPEAFVQSARGPARQAAELARQAAARTLEAAGSLFAALSGRNSDDRKAVFAAPASEYVPGDAYNERAVWVGAVGQSELDQICPRNREVQAIADAVAADVRASGDYMGARDFGNKVHIGIADFINDQTDPGLVAETSYNPITGADEKYGAKGSMRLDILEDARPSTVCVYDHKTGEAFIKATRAVDIMSVVQKNYPGTTRYILIEIKPKS